MSHKSRRRSSGGSRNDVHEHPSAIGTAVVEHTPTDLGSEHRQVLPEKNFRWRAGEITRLEAFSDVVFGFALTLLVISLEVPRNYPALIEDLRGFAPFALCFAQLAVIWRVHYIYSRRYGLEDSYSVFLNMILLFLVVFYVYPLKFVFTLAFSQLIGGDVGREVGSHEASVLMRFYSIGFASVFLLFTLMYAHAYRLRTKLKLSILEVEKTRVSIQQNTMLAVIGVVSLAISFKRPVWAGFLYIALGPLLGSHGIIASKRIRQLVAERT